MSLKTELLVLPRLDWQWSRRKYVMAVINATPDSFSADGLFAGGVPDIPSLAESLAQAVRSGADILDIGAESTRPGSCPIPANEQIARLTPVLAAAQHLVARGDVSRRQWCVSLDTSDAEVAEWGLRQGVQIINDVHGGRDQNLLDIVAEYQAEIVLMHNSSVQNDVINNQDLGSSYSAETDSDIVTKVKDSLCDKAEKAQKTGILPKNIFLDPGIGFGKSLSDNLRLITGCNRLAELGYPLLVGASRKSFLGKILNLSSDQRLEASLMVHGEALMRGAHMIRVHDVQEHHRIRRMAEALHNPEKYDHD